MFFVICTLHCLILSNQDTNSTTAHFDSVNSFDFYWAPEWRSESDCGQIAAYFVARLYGKEVSVGDVKNEMPTYESGASCAQLEDYLSKKGLQFRTAWVNPESFKDLPVPAIVHADYGRGRKHFYVLLDIDKVEDKFTVLDTSFGGMKAVDGREIRSHATGYVMVHRAAQRPYWIIAALAIVVGFVMASKIISSRRRSGKYKAG